MKKKVVSLCLAFILIVSLLPMGTVSAEAGTVYPVYICGVGYNYPEDNETIYGGDDGEVASETDATWWLEKSGSNYTLTLEGFDAKPGLNHNAVIDISGDFNIVFKDDNYITMSVTSENESYGIYARGDLTIDVNEGSFAANGGVIEAVEGATVANAVSCGIYVDGDLYIEGEGRPTANGRNITADAGAAVIGATSCGIWAEATVEISGGEVECTGGNAEATGNSGKAYSYGLCAGKDINAAGGYMGFRAGVDMEVDSCGEPIQIDAIETMEENDEAHSYGVYSTGGIVAVKAVKKLSIGRAGEEFTGLFMAEVDNGKVLEFGRLVLNNVGLRDMDDNPVTKANAGNYSGFLRAVPEASVPQQPQPQESYRVVGDAGTPLPDVATAPEVQEINPNTGLWRLF